MNFLIDKIDLFCSKIRIFRTWTFPRADGIQEASGSIPLISTTRSLETLVFQGFLFSPEAELHQKNEWISALIWVTAETVGEAPCFLQKRGAFSFWGGKNGGGPVYWMKLFVDRAARMDGPAFDVQLTCVKKKGNGR